VLVTRGGGQSTALVQRLRDSGAEVVEVPTVRIAPPRDPAPLAAALGAIAAYDWLLLTSANAVSAVADAAAATPLPATLRFASAGPATTAAIRARFPGTPVTAQATNAFGGEGLGQALALVYVSASRMLFPVSDRSPAALAAVLRARGALVDVVVAYRTEVPEGADDQLRATLAAGIDAVTFASPSAVEAFAFLGEAAGSIPAVVIGPTTAFAASAAGFRVAATAREATGESLADAVLACLAARATSIDLP
jgi:uroporphyrinogen-III synthase